jgi:hypothetical protein
VKNNHLHYGQASNAIELEYAVQLHTMQNVESIFLIIARGRIGMVP